MKTKKILFVVAFAAVTLLSGFNYVQNNNEVKLSDLALANVEALANGRINDLCPDGCVSNGDGCYCYFWYDNFKSFNWGDDTEAAE